MMVLDGICEKCNRVCNSIHFHQNFNNWTSGNNDIDKFIQNTQLSAHDDIKRALEWIPYDRLLYHTIKYITDDDKFDGEVYRANWIDGCINEWDDENINWERKNQNMFVILKLLNNPEKITSEFKNKV
jgi:hypothetical protein